MDQFSNIDTYCSVIDEEKNLKLKKKKWLKKEN